MEHHHGHHRHEHRSASNVTKAFIAGIILNSAFVLIEAAAGLFTHSLSLLADAGHNLTDVASLALALLANKLAAKKANEQYSFGYRQSTVLVALINGGILLFALGAVAYEAIKRIAHPQPVQGGWVAVIAGAGIAINAASALMFLKHKEKDLNVKGAYLHMASDALISLGVVVAGMIIMYTGWFWLDPLVSLVLVAVIIFGTWGLLSESLRLTLNGVPADINIKKVRNYLLTLPGVTGLHDLHIWAISTTETALTVHLVMPAGLSDDDFYRIVQDGLHHEFNITHATVQVERNKMDFDCG